MFAAARQASDLCRAGAGPAVVVAETFRMGGHATHDEREARKTFSPELFTAWGRRDPIGLYEEFLKVRGVAPEELLEVEEKVTAEVEAAAAAALDSRERVPSPERALFEGISEGGTLVGLQNRPI